MPLISREVTPVPPGLPEPVKVWLENILKAHYADIKALCNKLLIENWRIEQDATTGDYKIMEWNASTETWDDTGNTIVAS